MSFSIVICTRNRANLLADAIKSLQNQHYPASAYEIIVVDNASTDNTYEIVEKMGPCCGETLRYVYEPMPGLSRARNSGLRESRYEIVGYIDDDAIADPEWLANLARAYQSLETEVACVGGAVSLLWEGEPPRWYSTELEPYFSSTTHLGTKARVLPPEESPVGTNLTVRRDILLHVGGFNESLTRYNDEVDLGSRIRRAGGVILYAPAALVQHRVVAERLSLGWLLRRAYWQGASDVLMDRRKEPLSRCQLAQSTVATLGQAAVDGTIAALAFVAGRHPQAVYHLFWAAGRMGRVRTQAGILSGRSCESCS